jgi:uncharacterized membrane protein YkoI
MRAARSLLLLLAAISAMSTVTSVTSAQELIDRRAQREHRPAQVRISLDDAVRMAQNRYGAKAVKAETVTNGGRRVHQIRLLSAEGKVWMVRVDAETGSMN